MMTNTTACVVPDCEGRGRIKRGYCERHYQQIRTHGEVQPDLSDADRFWMRVDKSGGSTACWPWRGEILDTGYGAFWLGKGRRKQLAHRYSLALTGVDIDGFVVRHACDNPPCVNPAHLSSGTQGDNMRDMVARGRINNIGIWVEKVKACAGCDATFTGPGRQDYCTPECCAEAKRRRRRGLSPRQRNRVAAGVA